MYRCTTYNSAGKQHCYTQQLAPDPWGIQFGAAPGREVSAFG